MDWMSLNICFWSATSVSRIFPFEAGIFKVLQIVVGSAPETEISSLRFLFSVSSPEGHFQADRCRADALSALSFQGIESKLSALK
jgi:hypothetical protein